MELEQVFLAIELLDTEVGHCNGRDGEYATQHKHLRRLHPYSTHDFVHQHHAKHCAHNAETTCPDTIREIHEVVVDVGESRGASRENHHVHASRRTNLRRHTQAEQQRIEYTATTHAKSSGNPAAHDRNENKFEYLAWSQLDFALAEVAVF